MVFAASCKAALIAAVLLIACNIGLLCQQADRAAPAKPDSDAVDYEAIGWGLANGIGLSTELGNPQWQALYRDAGGEYEQMVEAKSGPVVPRTDRPPLLPLVIAAIYKTVGRNAWGMFSIRCFLAVCLSLAGAVAVGLTFATSYLLIGNTLASRLRIKFAWLAAIVCGIIAVSDRTARSYTQDYLTELPAMLATQCFFIAVLITLFSPRQKYVILSGVLLAVMLYTRSLFIVWLPGLWVLLLWLNYISGVQSHGEFNTHVVESKFIRSSLRGSWRRAAWRSSSVVGIALLLMLPWLIRNCIVLKEFSPLGTKGSITLMGGYCDAAYRAGGAWQVAPESQARANLVAKFGDSLQTSTQTNLELEKQLQHDSKIAVRQWIFANWSKLPLLMCMRVIDHFNPYWGVSGFRKLFALIGAVVLVRRLPQVGWFAVGLIGINAFMVSLMYSVGGRFLVPLYGIVYMLAALGVCWLLLVTRLLVTGSAWNARMLGFEAPPRIVEGG